MAIHGGQTAKFFQKILLFQPLPVLDPLSSYMNSISPKKPSNYPESPLAKTSTKNSISSLRY